MTAAVDTGAHHAAQRAVVRMLYDRTFAEAVRRDPVAAGLSPEVARLVGGGGGIDPRALRGDPLRARRTLGLLAEEFKASSVLVLDESRSMALLDGFFGSPEFHGAVEAEAPLVLAYGAYLAALCRAGRLGNPRLPDVIALEEMQARARREASPVPARVEAAPPPERVRLAPGVIYRRLAADALDAIRQVDQLLFELGLVPGLGLATDGPRLAQPAREAEVAMLSLVAVAHERGLSLVTLDEELRAILEPLSSAGALPAAELVNAAMARGLDGPRAEALLVELLDQEVLCAAPEPPAQ